MTPAQEIGRLLLVAGVVLAAAGALLVFHGRLPLLGQLPGDIVWKRGSFTLYLPLATSLLLSLLLTVLFRLIGGSR